MPTGLQTNAIAGVAGTSAGDGHDVLHLRLKSNRDISDELFGPVSKFVDNCLTNL